MPELYIGTIGLGAIITGLIQAFKQFGFPSRYVWLLNIGLAALFIVVIGLVGEYPDLLQPVTLALNVLIAVLSAGGFYTVTKNVAGR